MFMKVPFPLKISEICFRKAKVVKEKNTLKEKLLKKPKEKE